MLCCISDNVFAFIQFLLTSWFQLFLLKMFCLPCKFHQKSREFCPLLGMIDRCLLYQISPQFWMQVFRECSFVFQVVVVGIFQNSSDVQFSEGMISNNQSILTRGKFSPLEFSGMPSSWEHQSYIPVLWAFLPGMSWWMNNVLQ